jgi:hypothetical protein
MAFSVSQRAKGRKATTYTVRRRATAPLPIDPDFRAMLERIWERQGGCCAITGRPLVWDKKRHPDYVVPDQIVPGLGYTEDNVQLVGQRINRIKSDGTEEEHLLIAVNQERNRVRLERNAA